MTQRQLSRAVQRSFVTIILWSKRIIVFLLLVITGWLAYKLFIDRIIHGHDIVLGFTGTWVIAAYIVIPRVNRALARWYVPDYFIGRVRSNDGLLSDPVNIAIRGTEDDLLAAMKQAGWVRANELSLKTSIKIVRSTLLRRSYREAPVSTLFLFGNKQDFAFQQEVDGNPSRRHHVRFWKCPKGWLLPGGYQVDWLAAGTYDRSLGFSSYNLQITHKIAENTDIERDHIIETLQKAKTTKNVQIITNFTTGYHDSVGGGDRIRTDGALPIITL